jgi:hypothetical protein
MAIQGLRDTSGFVTDQRPKNWREGILLLYPNGKLALTALTSLMKSKSTDDPEYSWWDKKLSTRRLLLSATIASTDTALAVTAFGTTSDGAKAVKEGDLLWSEKTGEIMRVMATPTSDTGITVQRGFAGSTAAAITPATTTDNPYLVVMGSAYEESSMAPTGVNFDPTKRFNYTQIFRNTLEMSRTASKTRLRTGDQVKEAKRETLELHGMDIERAFWFGKRTETTINGKIARSCDGFLNVIDSGNIKTVTTDYPSGLTMTGLEEYMYNAFKFGSSEKVGFCGNRALLTLQQVLRKNATWQFMSGVKEYGMTVSRIISPFGEVVLKTHPLFNQMTGSGTASTNYYGLESWLWIADMDNFVYRYMEGSDTQYQKDLGANDLDGMKSGYLTEASIEIHHPVTHYLLKNLVKSAVG